MSSSQRGPPKPAQKPARKCGTFDMHGYLNEVMRAGGDETTGSSQPQINTSGPIIPVAPVISNMQKEYGFEDVEIYVDSAYASALNRSAGEITFPVTLINNNQIITNIVGVRIEKFYFQLLPTAVGSPSPYFFQRVFIRLNELPTTAAVSANNGIKYHFEMEVLPGASVALPLMPLNDDIVFARPVISLSELTIRFTVPPALQPIPLLETSILVEAINALPAQFRMSGAITYPDIMGILPPVFPVVPPAPGVAVYFADYPTPAANSSVVNRGTGHYITAFLTNNTFELAGLPAITLGATATMLVAKNRFALSLRFTCLRNTITNRVVVTQT